MNLIETKQLSLEQKENIQALWNSEYPEKLRHATIQDLEVYLDALQNKTHFFLGDRYNLVAAWAFCFEREKELWFAIIVRSHNQRLGYGSLLLEALKKKRRCLSGWVIDHSGYKKSNGQAYNSPLAFYLKNGFTKLPDLRLETENLSAVKILWCLDEE